MWHTYYIGRRTNLFQLEKVNVSSDSNFTKAWSWSMKCDVLCTGRHLSKFRGFLLSPPSGYKTRSSCFSYPESEEIMFLWWNGKFLPGNKALNLTRQCCSQWAPLQRRILQEKATVFFFNCVRVELQISCKCLWYERTRPKSVLSIIFKSKLTDRLYCTLNNHSYCNFSLSIFIYFWCFLWAPPPLYFFFINFLCNFVDCCWPLGSWVSV